MTTASDSSPIKAPIGKENFAQRQGNPKAMENNDDEEVLTDPSPNQDGSEFVVSEDESSDNSSDPDAAFTDDEEKQTKWNRPTPEGARRSHRNNKEEGDGDAANGNDNGTATPDDDNNTATAQDEEDEDDEYFLSPNSVVLKRDVSDEQVEADLDEIRDMWEMASIHDFLRLFKPQLKISRGVGPDELEHVLVTSPGDGGLLADIHIDLMKGTSPKNPISVANWITHLANKIKHHWKHIPMSGLGCPFKPDKYYEAVTYSRLSSVNRVRALHFLCCLRADRPDIAGRISDADRPKTKKELAEAAKAAAAAAALKGSRNNLNEEASPAPPMIEEVDIFRLSPIGIDSSKIAYYFFTCHDNTGFRLYRELPPASIRSNSRRKSLDDKIVIEATDDESEDDEDSLDDYEVPEYPPGGKWELIATTLDELEAIAERLNRSMKAADKALAVKLTTDIMSEIHERLEAEERRMKAAQRVQRRLGVDAAGAADEGLRPRRSRAVVNYAFTEYDDILRSAIRRSQRGGPVDEQDGKRRRAYSPSYYDPIDEAMQGLRRGRSAAALKAGEPSVELDERKLRMQRLSSRRREDGGVDYNEDDEDDDDEDEDERREARTVDVGTAREEEDDDDDDEDSPMDDDEVMEIE